MIADLVEHFGLCEVGQPSFVADGLASFLMFILSGGEGHNCTTTVTTIHATTTDKYHFSLNLCQPYYYYCKLKVPSNKAWDRSEDYVGPRKTRRPADNYFHQCTQILSGLSIRKRTHIELLNKYGRQHTR